MLIWKIFIVMDAATLFSNQLILLYSNVMGCRQNDHGSSSSYMDTNQQNTVYVLSGRAGFRTQDRPL